MGTWHDDRVTAGRGSLSHLNDPRRQLVIVALPDEDDPVRKYSSEKEPHLTLLYLGAPDYDDDQIAHIEGYVQHAASLIHNFVLEVESRGELGDKSADVLFLRKRWSREIVTFREQLLQDPLISAAYHSADQFPEWVPHLTMGYPDSPAKKDESETPRFYSVNFNRIALWTGDSKGPTVFLKPYDYDPEVAMSQITQGRSFVKNNLSHSGFNLEDEYGGFLDLIEKSFAEIDDEQIEHFGIKGMKWGVRKEESSSGRESSSQEPLKSLGPNSVSRTTESGETITLQKTPTTKFQNFVGKHSKKYREEFGQQAYLHILDGSGKRVGEASIQKRNDEELYLEWLGINKSSRGKGYASAVMKAGRDFGKQEGYKRMILDTVDSPDARHIYEKLGFEYTGEANTMVYDFDAKHSDSLDDILAHFGIKGMKWGIRRADTSASAVPASSDARVADEAAAKIKTSGVKTLSNQELKVLVERMNLEQRYSTMLNDKAKNSRVNRGHDKVKKALKVAKTANEIHKFAQSDVGKLIRQTVEAGLSDVARKAAA